ncbi:MAG: hypothetical protein VB060_01985 [Oscillibacter sp.]|nr:hypothetical protein [Oscillibacter sp.]MEA4992592.1 hypothetical protein [Oscillibacter sp.]
MKKVISTALVFCALLSMTCVGAIDPQQLHNDFEDLCYINNRAYFYAESVDTIWSMEVDFTNCLINVFKKDKATNLLYCAQCNDNQIRQSMSRDAILSIMHQIQNQDVSFTLYEALNDNRLETNNIIVQSVDATTMTDLLRAKHGASYIGKVLVRQSGPNNTYARLTESLTYDAGERTSEYLSAGTSLVAGAAKVGIVTAKLVDILGSYIVNNVIVVAVEVGIYHATARWTRIVYVNDTYQYYAGKDIQYRVAYFQNKTTGLTTPITVKQADFDDKDALVQKGFDNYFNS